MALAGTLEIFRHSLTSIVEEMGVTLQRTAYSTNIKTRRDHTCALFDDELRQISQHDIAPQHIGAMVRAVPENVTDRDEKLGPGDAILVNDPYRGTTHLPDVFLISPIYWEDELVGYAANSAHHVDIGGGTPGGIPTDSTELYAEGLIFPGIKAVENWEFDDEVIDLITRNVRDPEMRLGDYRAQLGTNRIAEQRYGELIDEYGRSEVSDLLDELLDYTERRVREAIQDLPDGVYEAEDYFDGDGVAAEDVKMALTIEIDGDEMVFDFTGTDDQSLGPLNSGPSMVLAGVMSVIMSLIGKQLPKNDGFYRAFELVAPNGTIVNPNRDAPVAGVGEVAIRASELVTKAMADALPEETIAGSKGTIVNVAYGGTDPRTGEKYVFYETVGGGYGARAQKDGLDGVQAHFQNTANSPIEELEREVPVRIREYSLVDDSAGAGRNRGGLGIRRDMEFYDHDASVSLLCDRAKYPPWGLFGGQGGDCAAYEIYRDGGDDEVVPSKSSHSVSSGDVVSVQTPGGGGYGDPLERDPARVLDDVRNGKISTVEAETEYSVVLDGETVDEAATEDRRDDRRQTRSEGGVSR